MNPKDLANSIIERAMKMQTFRIIRTRPDDFEFNGRVPFDVKINKEDIMTFTIHALTLEDANKQVDKYLQENSGL
jgi:hypothetical protein